MITAEMNLYGVTPYINKWFFSRPAVTNVLSEYGTAVTGFADAPVFTVNEQPESDTQYVVYFSRGGFDGANFAVNNDIISYMVVDNDVLRLMAMERLARHYLGRLDRSAQEFNKWLYANHTEAGISVKAIRYWGSTAASPEDQEGGVMGKTLTFEVEYVDALSLQEQTAPN